MKKIIYRSNFTIKEHIFFLEKAKLISLKTIENILYRVYEKDKITYYFAEKIMPIKREEIPLLVFYNLFNLFEENQINRMIRIQGSKKYIEIEDILFQKKIKIDRKKEGEDFIFMFDSRILSAIYANRKTINKNVKIFLHKNKLIFNFNKKTKYSLIIPL